MEASHIGKWLVFIGIGICVVGILFWFGGKIGIPIGKLPGDFHVQREKFSLYAPIATSILISIFLTVIINLVLWLLRR
jgi:hypothetical protein